MPLTPGGINILLMGYSVFIIAAFYLLYPSRQQIRLSFPLILLVAIFTFLFFFLPSGSLSSYFYSLYFVGCFVLLIDNYKSCFTRNDLSATISGIILLYFFVMLVQQAATVFGLPVINLNPGFEDGFVESLYLFRLNSLASEPSYGATIIIIITYVYYCINGITRKGLWAAYLPGLYLLIFFQSSLGVILFGLIMLVILWRQAKWGLLLSPVLFFLFRGQFLESRIGIILAEFNIKNLEGSFLDTDLSGAFRVVPNILFVKTADPLSLQFWLGHGYGYASNYISSIMPGIDIEDKFVGGVLPFQLFDYGFITFLATLLFLFYNSAAGNKWIFIFIMLIVMINANFNTQLFWLFITIFAIYRQLPSENNEPEENVKSTNS
jgi:hypothetical protein